MLPINLRITLIIAVVCYFVLILLFLKNKSISLKYTLLWLFAGLIMGIMVFFPGTLVFLVHLLGIESNMNGLFILAIGFVIIILMSLTSIVSKQANRIKILVQQQAIMEKRIRDLEKKEINEK